MKASLFIPLPLILERFSQLLVYSRMEKVALLCFVLCLVTLAHEAQGRNIFRRPSLHEGDLEIERQLRILNKPAVMSFKTEHGVIFDCVDIYKQPAFDHPLLKNHTLQTELSPDAKRLLKSTSKGSAHTNTGMELECPAGTVLIRRTTKEDLLRANYSDNVYFPQPRGSNGGSHVALLMFRGGGHGYYGAQALMDVYALPVGSNQISAGLISLINGLGGSANLLNVIQFGWHIFPLMNGDKATHFFTRWTSDGFQRTGCLNMLCEGYVQVSRRFTPGMPLNPGKAAIKLTLYKDKITRNWVLVQDDANHEMLGYWHADLFNNMDAASIIQMGGGVSSPPLEASPPMGSGIFPNEKGACEFKQVAFMHGEGDAFSSPRENGDYAEDKPQFYTVGKDYDYGGDIGFRFEFGGPGSGV